MAGAAANPIHGLASAAVLALVSLSACGGGSSGGTGAAGGGGGVGGGGSSTNRFSLSATISGLNTSGLVLSVNGTSVAVNSGATSQVLAGSLASGTTYSVTVAAQPAGETCTATSNSGTMPASNVTNVAISCTPNTYTVGGSITGLDAGELVLLDNGGDATTVSANATSFTMHTGVVYGGNYAVTVQTNPTGLVCTVNNGSGTMGQADITNISIGCLKNLRILASLTGYPSSATNPYAALVQGSSGELYGTSEAGGSHDLGTAFVIYPSNGALSLLHSFAGSLSDGASPYGDLVEDSAGQLYGTTEAGGNYQYCTKVKVCLSSYGTVFRINASSGAVTLLHSFRSNVSGGQDGAHPYAGVMLASNGYLYGTTVAGGASGNGTVFRLGPDGGEAATLHSFAGGSSDGAEPYSKLIQASDGNLYGTTKLGGSAGAGTVFQINPAIGAESIVYAFKGGSSDGASPYDALIQAKDGNFYGTTGAGGASAAGTVFRISATSGAESVVYAFAGGGSDGANPYAGVIQASDGNLYGTTVSGGPSGDGTVFRINPTTGAESLVYAFAGGSTDGSQPYGGLLQAKDGNLYGTTLKGGSNDAGVLFQITLQ